MDKRGDINENTPVDDRPQKEASKTDKRESHLVTELTKAIRPPNAPRSEIEDRPVFDLTKPIRLEIGPSIGHTSGLERVDFK